ncbi:hypothetical protein CAPTEDRAFT_198599 [Capitella teleta]|uniref:C2H2-type domain-containing protein n=1 Tax=Capitella teleta TaxID=283909 RepID=R7UZL4_CAPTE|nr:hypothetical protein CAPTEDRAFT_198599 [Capitella teleta]|eukprot:ELU11729.1 hypothetical protein CAPTEDRAFT_198599 [Capitella teleta]
MSIEDLHGSPSEESPSRPRRQRHDSIRAISGCTTTERTLDVKGVMSVLSAYSGSEGGINCSICGKLYKSKVCLTKHLWEHSVYWEMFDDEKNQDRVLSIQAALILYSGPHHVLDMTSLLVTSPHDKKAKSPEKRVSVETTRSVKRRLTMKGVQRKRLRTISGGSDSGICSSSDSEQVPASSLHRIDI